MASDTQPNKSRPFAGMLDTALLVFFGLVVLLIAWKLFLGIVGTVWLLVRLAFLALVIAFAIKAWLSVKSRRNR